MNRPPLDKANVEEHFRLWNAVPLSDLRGQVWVFNNHLLKSFEDKLPPWRRWRKKSNGRYLLGNSRVIKAIRGIHIRTRGMK